MSGETTAQRTPGTAGSGSRRLRRALGTTAAAVAVLVAVLLLVGSIAMRLSPGGRYAVLGHPVLVVLSGSMTGTIDTGDLIVGNPIDPAAARRLRAGQVITFHDAPGSSMVVTHRILRVVHRNGAVLYETKGDANQTADLALRPASTVFATYAWRIPRGGRFLVNLRRPDVLGLLLLAPILWLLGGALRQMGRDEPAGEAPGESGAWMAR